MSFREIQEFSLIVPNFFGVLEELAESAQNFRINNTFYLACQVEKHYCPILGLTMPDFGHYL